MTKKNLLKIPVAKIGKYYKEDLTAPLGYKTIEFTQDDFDFMISNPRARGYETPLRRGHNKKGQGIQDGETADGHLVKFVQEDDVLFGEFEANNDKVVEEIENGEFRYASGEFVRNALSKKNPADRIPIFVKAVGLTNTPFVPDLPRATLINCSDGEDAFFRLALVEATEEVLPQTVEENPVLTDPKSEKQNLADLSLDDIRKEVVDAFKKNFCTGHCGDYCYCGPYVQGVYHDAGYLVAMKGSDSYRYDYTKDSEGYTFEEPQKVLMQFEVVENLSDELKPKAATTSARLTRIEKMFAKVFDLFAGQKSAPEPVSLSEEANAPEPTSEAPAPDADEIVPDVKPEPVVEPDVTPETPEAPATDSQEVSEENPEGDDVPAVAPVEPAEPTSEEETNVNPEEIAAMQAELEELRQLKVQREAEIQNLADQAFENSVTAFVAEASKFITPAAAQMLAGVIRANRGAEAFSLSEGEDPVSLSDALLGAVKVAVPTVGDVLAPQAGEISLSDSEEAPANPFAARIEALKAEAAARRAVQ